MMFSLFFLQMNLRKRKENIWEKFLLRGEFVFFKESFLDLESKVQETLEREDREFKCSICPEFEACISGEPLAIPCPLEGKKNDA